MIRYGLWSFSLVLLVSCAQTPAPGANVVPTVPTTLSTDLDDTAHSVAADVLGNAYVLGYRNYDGDFRTGKVEHPIELFVSQLGPKGTLNWLTNLPRDILADDLNAPGLGLSLAVTDAAVYALTSGDTGVAQLHRLEFNGTLSWSKVISQEGLSTGNLLAAPNGTLYVMYHSDTWVSTLKAFNGEGSELWSRELADTSLDLLGVGGDGGLYFGEVVLPPRPGYAGGVYIHKFDDAGLPLWTRDVSPSIPFYIEPPANPPSVTLAVRGDAVYTSVDFDQQAPESTDRTISNTEIRRFAGDGTEVWSTLLYPAATGSLAFDYHVFPVGVTNDADLYLLIEEREPEGPNPNPPESYVERYKEQLFQFSRDGQRTTSAVQTYSDGLEDAVLVPAQIKDARNRPHTVFYTVSTVGKNLFCDNDFDLPEPCVYTDVQTSLYKNNAALQWSLR